MIVSCLCPTYNRAPNHISLLEDVVESFHLQTLTPDIQAELIILNDTPDQELACSVPDVHIINVPRRIDSLGEKRNELIRWARGDILLPWDDDDISLPGRIIQAVERLAKGYAYFNPQRTWFLDGNGLHSDHTHGYCHNASAFTRRAWEEVGGYPATSGNEDAIMDQRLRTLGSPRLAPPLGNNPSEWTYVYRWGVSPHHLSGVSDGFSADPHRTHYHTIGSKPISTGKFSIEIPSPGTSRLDVIISSISSRCQ